MKTQEINITPAKPKEGKHTPPHPHALTTIMTNKTQKVTVIGY